MKKLIKILGIILILIFSYQQFVYAGALSSALYLYTKDGWIYYQDGDMLVGIPLVLPLISLSAFFIIFISTIKYLILKVMTNQKTKKGIIYDKDKTEKKKDKIQFVIYLCVIILSITLSIFWGCLYNRSL